MHRYQHLLERIETEAKDELTYFNQLDPHHFTTVELYRLLGQWEVKHQLFKQIQHFILWTVAISPIWLVAAYIFNLLTWTKLTILSLILFPCSFVIFFAGLYFMNITFHGKGHLEEVGEKIKGELKKRQQKNTQV